MVGFCTVCKLGAGEEDDISFHRMPKNEKTRANWFAFIGRETSLNAGICSKHFKESDFIYKVHGDGVRRFLKPGASPSILQTSQRQNTQSIIKTGNINSCIPLRTENNTNLERRENVNSKELVKPEDSIYETIIDAVSLKDIQLKKQNTQNIIETGNINSFTSLRTENNTNLEGRENVNSKESEELQKAVHETIMDTANSIDIQLKRKTDNFQATAKRFCNPRYIGDLRREDFTSDRSWQLFECHLAETKIKMKYFHQKVTKLNKEVESLQAIINHIKKIQRFRNDIKYETIIK